MHADETCDVAVVGASLSGCAAATLLGRAGLRVALIDKQAGADAYKRLCGHYIQASATPTIERLGLASELTAAGAHRNGVDVWTRWGTIAAPDRPDRSRGYSVRRAKLDPLVREVALGTSGVRYMPRHEAVALMRHDRAVAGVELRDRAGKRTRIAARLVVGADGRNSKVARLAGVRERKAPNERFCYMAYFRGVGLPAGSRGRLWMLDPDVAIASPNDDGITVLAAFPHKSRLPDFLRDPEAAIWDMFRRLPEPPGLDAATIDGKVIGYRDYGIVSRPPAPLPGLALVGDAAMTSDPVMAIGCGWALQSGEWLADAVTSTLAAAAPVAAGARAYAIAHRRRLGGHQRMLIADARGRRMNPVQRLLFSAAARDRRVARVFHEYAERSIGPRELLAPGVLTAALTANVRRPRASAVSTRFP